MCLLVHVHGKGEVARGKTGAAAARLLGCFVLPLSIVKPVSGQPRKGN
jgi:hypothetical protein